MQNTEKVMPNLFISYRREDSAPYAGRLADRLGSLFGADSVFMDVVDIRPGQDFSDAIEKTIAQCHVLIAVIGPRWLDSIRERMEAHDDFVRSEIGEALRKKLLVIPVLVGGAKMPEPQQLPEVLQPLSRYQAVEIRDSRFDDDFAQISSILSSVPGFAAARPALPPAASKGRGSRLKWWAGAAVVLFGAIGLFFALRPRAPGIDGEWTAEMHKKGQPPYRIRLDLVVADGTINGTVDYPTGTGRIQNGTIAGGKLAFQTVHTPQFETQPATSSFRGEVTGPTIALISVDDNGVATGTAHRIAPPTAP